jgi:uncharacterized RDD family membrane protein YckC
LWVLLGKFPISSSINILDDMVSSNGLLGVRKIMDSPPEISTANTIMPRHFAAIFDNLLATILGVLAAKSVEKERLVLQLIVFVVVYLGFYVVFELSISRTPGKLLTGLVIVRTDGSEISVSDVAIRTLFRVLEVNPALLGAVPAAISIIFSKRNQRIGDRIAGTIVVPPGRIPR